MAGEIDATNRFAVGVRKNKVIVLKWGRELTHDEAMNLAAWLVASAEVISSEVADEFSGQSDFDAWRNAVRST